MQWTERAYVTSGMIALGALVVARSGISRNTKVYVSVSRGTLTRQAKGEIMRYTVRKSLIQVIGRIWMPDQYVAHTYDLTIYDVENAKDEDGNITRESIQDWLDTNAGDFQSFDDFWASIEVDERTIEIDWANEESELIYNDATFGFEDE